MTRRSGKARPQPHSSSATDEVSTPRTHLTRHLHLANIIHVKNHIHMREKDRMPDPWRASQLPALRRELTAVKKVKSLQDPSSSYHSFSPGSGAAGHDECRASCNGGAHLDETVRRCKGREEFVDRIRGPCHGNGHGERRDTDLAQWSDGHDHELFSTSCPRLASYGVDERWHATEIARRLISEQNGRIISSPAHAYMSSLARAHGVSLLRFRDDITNSETEGSSFPESEAELLAPDHLSNSAAGSPLVIRGRRNRRRWKDASHGTNGNLNLRVRFQSSRARTNGYKETRSIAGEELLQGEVELQPREPQPASVIKSQCEAGDEEAGSQVCNPSMSYKHRPRSFKDMVGQTLVVKSLTTVITKGINQALPHVYLFSGPPGTGKTTCAGIFAAALVCRNVEPHRRPCGLCRECEALICNRISRDVKEVDVGNSPDLDHIRSLLNLSLSSNSARHRVFIVKGCDSLSTELCISFLKLLYDLPRNVFILITTDLERLPVSATSRCQKYHFGKLKESEIVTRLQVLVEKENLSVDEAALSLIASRAGGSLRDAESMLDQLSLLDQTITLSTVQELSGVIPDEKLVDLLDTALAADTANTVKGMRELLDAGIDALSLVGQLASLITNILAGAFDLQKETVRTKRASFFHRDMSRREQQQRLRQALKVLSECEKQLRASNDKPTWLAAALLQFAPDRSYLPSSMDTSKAASPIAFDTTFESQVPPGDQPPTPRLPPPQPSARKRHSQKRSPNIDVTSRTQGQSLRNMEKASSPAGKTPWPPSGNQFQANLVRGDDRTAIGSALFDSSRVSNRGFRLLPRRDVEHIWDKVLDGCRSNALRQLLSSHGSLVALSVASDEACAVALVEFRSSQHRARAERMRSSTCHAFQMALGCPVELKLSLVWSCPPFVALKEPPDAQLRNIPPRSSRHEMLTGLAARSRRLAGAGISGRRRLSSHANPSNYKYCFPAAGSSRRSYRSGRRPSFTRLPSLESAKSGVRVRWKHPKFKGIPNTQHRNRKLKPRRKRTRRVALCWQSPLSEREQLPHQGQEPEHSRKVGFFLRLVPCGRPIWTQGSPSRP